MNRGWLETPKTFLRHGFSLSAWTLPLNEIKPKTTIKTRDKTAVCTLPPWTQRNTPAPARHTHARTHTELIGNKYVKLCWLLITNPWQYPWDESQSIAQECTITPASATILSRMSNKNTNRNREGRAQIRCSVCTSTQTINCSASNYRNHRVEVGEPASSPFLWSPSHMITKQTKSNMFFSNRQRVKPLKGFISVECQSTGPPPQRPSTGCSSTWLRDKTAKERKHRDKQGDRDQYWQ